MKKLLVMLLVMVLCVGTALAEPVGDAALADYVGVWEAVMVDQNGLQVTMSEAGMSMLVTVIGSGEVLIQEGTAEIQAFAVEEGGTLLLLVGDAQAAVMQLRTDGMLTCTMTQDGTTIYFEKVTA